ncbi:hypothetical protein [Halomonas organivorans]|uniref:Uncharacterized protein n=1 Tax=Halomonas organivorans TaxID=257772 RepID=A0A7W5G592_9GAMM|nr:hypothetical protein [Halomonas organivorans]MBB3141243.1 hypothetical protein [Halomonas organivorans]
MSNVMPIRPATAPRLDPENEATAHLWRHPGLPRAVAIDSCIEHLVVNREMTEHAAENAALQAYAEMESMNKVDRIDVEASSAHAVVLKRAGGSRVVLTVKDLLTLVESSHCTAANTDSRRLLVLERASH